jgi:hypothetical protein
MAACYNAARVIMITSTVLILHLPQFPHPPATAPAALSIHTALRAPFLLIP